MFMLPKKWFSKKSRPVSLGFAVYIIMILFVVVYAENAWDQGYRVPQNSGSVDVNVSAIDGPCYTVTNDNTDTDFFIPTRTQAEWDAFVAHVPDNIYICDCGYADCNRNGSCDCVLSTHSCVDNECVEDCYDECNFPGEKQCYGTTKSYDQTCGEYDGDPCLEWSDPHYCGSDYCLPGWSDWECVIGSPVPKIVQYQTCIDRKCDETTGYSCADVISYVWQENTCFDEKCWEPYCSGGECGADKVQYGFTDEACYGNTGCLGTGCFCNGDGDCIATCAYNSYSQCYNNDRYWYDSCGVRGEVRQDCPYTCEGDMCCVSNKGTGCGGSACMNAGTIQCDGSCVGTSPKTPGTDCGLCATCDGAGSCNQMPADDTACGIIDCDTLDHYRYWGRNAPDDFSYCNWDDYHDITTNRCKSLGTCKDTSDCEFSTSTEVTAGICVYMRGDTCEDTTAGEIGYYSSAYSCPGGTCDGAGNCNTMPPCTIGEDCCDASGITEPAGTVCRGTCGVCDGTSGPGSCIADDAKCTPPQTCWISDGTCGSPCPLTELSLGYFTAWFGPTNHGLLEIRECDCGTRGAYRCIDGVWNFEFTNCIFICPTCSCP